MKNKNTLIEMIGEIDEGFISEYNTARSERKKQKRKNYIRGAVSIAAGAAAMAVIAVAIPFFMKDEGNLPPVVTADSTDTSVSDTTAPNTQPQEGERFINYIGTDPGKSEAEVSPDVLYTPVPNKCIYLSEPLKKALEKTVDSALFAFTVDIATVKNGEAFVFPEREELSNRVSEAEITFTEKAELCAEKIKNELGIGSSEAKARSYSHPDYIAAKEEFLKIKTDYILKWGEAMANSYSGVGEALSSLGLTTLYDVSDPEYAVYLYNRGAYSVMVASKAQLLALAETEDFPYLLILSGAAENTENLSPTHAYSGAEISLSSSSKLTDALIAEYEKNGGEPIEVFCKIEYYGKSYETIEELNQAALDALGLGISWWDFYEMKDVDGDIIDAYLEEKRRIIYHYDYNEQVVNDNLKDGELTEMQNWLSAFTATLTYDRALELSRIKEIAYIDLAEKTADPSVSDVNDTVTSENE